MWKLGNCLLSIITHWLIRNSIHVILKSVWRCSLENEAIECDICLLILLINSDCIITVNTGNC